MAKIKQVSYYNREKGMHVDSHLEYQAKQVKGYSTSDGRFFVRIPDGYTDLVGTEEAKTLAEKWETRGRHYIAATGKDEGEAEKNFKAYMSMYFKSQTKEEKVILFRHESKKPGDDGIYYGEKRLSLAFDYRVCNKKTIGTASKYYQIIGDRESQEVKVGGNYVSDNWHEVPYSAESEEFLKTVKKGLVNLIEKFDEFIGSPVNLLKTIESKQKLLS